MPYRRRYTRRRTLRGRALRRKYRRVAKKVRRMVKSSTVFVQRKFWIENWQPTTVSTVGFWKYYQPRFIDMPSSGEFENVFDLYKINRVKVSFVPRFTEQQAVGGIRVDAGVASVVAGTSNVRLHTLIDPYTSTPVTGVYTATTLNQFMESGRVRTHLANRTVNVYYKPRVLQDTDVAASSSFSKCPWLRTNQGSGVPMRGFHVFAQDNNLSGIFNQTFDVFVTFYMQFKSLR